jgi:hypothetical protein
MTPDVEALRAYAKSGLRDMKRELALHYRTPEPLLRMIYADGAHYDFHIPEEAGDLMNEGLAKEILFDFLRRAGEKAGAVAWVIATEVHYAHGEGAADSGRSIQEHPSREDAICVTAQTATDVLWLTAVFVRDEARRSVTWIGPPLERALPQAEFSGRLKMFGATPEDVTGYSPQRKGAKRIGLDALLDLMGPKR